MTAIVGLAMPGQRPTACVGVLMLERDTGQPAGRTECNAADLQHMPW